MNVMVYICLVNSNNTVWKKLITIDLYLQGV